MIPREENTLHVITARSPHLQEQIVIDIIMEDEDLHHLRSSSVEIATMFAQKLSSLSVADCSTLLANKEALKLAVCKLGGKNLVNQPLDSFIPWLDEPLWKETYNESTGYLVYINLQTKEQLSGEAFDERVDQARICRDCIQFLSLLQRTTQWKVFFEQSIIGSYKDHWKESQKLKPLNPWKKKAFMEQSICDSSSTPEVCDTLKQRLHTMLQHSKYGTYEWCVAALIDSGVQNGCFRMIKPQGGYIRNLNIGDGCRGTRMDITTRDLAKMLMQSAYNVLPIREKEKHDFTYYQEKFSWVLDL